MTPADLIQQAALVGRTPAFHAYALVEPRPWGLGFLAWNATQWEATRLRLGLDPGWPSVLFADEHLLTCCITVAAHLAPR